MGDEMKGIVDGDADDDTRYAYHYHRHTVVHQCHASQGKEPSPSYGKGNEQDVPEAAEGIEQEQEDEDGCQGNGQDAVAYNLVCIPNGNLRSACHVCFHSGVQCLHLPDGLVKEGDKAGIHVRLAAAEG